MSLDPLFRRMAMIVTGFAFMGVLLGSIALVTDNWSKADASPPGTFISSENRTAIINDKVELTWNGLLRICTSRDNDPCRRDFMKSPFILCLLGLLCLLAGAIFSLLEIFKTNDRRFIIPMLYFVCCVLTTAGIFDYGSVRPLNSHSSRSMIAALVFAYSALPISAFIAGRYSAYDRYISNGHVHNGQKYMPTSTNGN